MERNEAVRTLRDELDKYGLQEWSIRWNMNPESHFLGMCLHRDKCIVLSGHHVDIHPTPDVINTIKHEVAHALTPGHGHDDTWAEKAREIGCDNTSPCSNLTLNPAIIDAIRSGATVEVTFDEQIIRTPKYHVTRLQDKCPECGKVAKTASEELVEVPDDSLPDIKRITLECGHVIEKQIPKGTPFHKFMAFEDASCQHEWSKNLCTKCGGFRLYPYQVDGARFLEAGLAVNKGAMCADEMGLGKTQQAGAVVFFHPELRPCLWIVKSGLKYQTSSFIQNWLPDQYPQVINTSKDWLIPGLQHYIIGYDMLVPKSRKLKSGKVVTSGFNIEQFDKVGIKCVILDECQQIKNVDSTRTQMVRRIVRSRKVIPLSGTPWNNRGSELFPVLNMMDPMKFNSEEAFRRRWVDTYWVGKYEKEGGIRNIASFKEHVKNIIIRRERTEVMSELPLVNRTKLNVIFNLEEEKVYDEAVDEFVKWYEEHIEGLSGMAIIAAMQKMRHLVALAKIPTTMEYLEEFVEDTDRKIAVFAHHIDVQKMLYEECKERFGDEILVLRYAADMNSWARNEAVEQFNSTKRAIMIMSQGAGGEGLNLQTCCDCLMHERQWNPGREEQCEGRFIRIGSVSTSVSAIYAHLQGLTAIDSRLDEIVERKRLQFHALMNKGEAPRWNEEAMMKELAESIVRAHKAKKRAA